MASKRDMSTKHLEIGKLSPLLGYHLRRASGVFAVDFQEAVAGTGMRQVLLGILSVIDANPGVNQGAVGLALGIKRANMVSLINELIDAELVTREVAEDDRRAFSLSLNDAGRTMLENSVARIQEREAQLLARFTQEERDALFKMLGKIVAPTAA